VALLQTVRGHPVPADLTFVPRRPTSPPVASVAPTLRPSSVPSAAVGASTPPASAGPVAPAAVPPAPASGSSTVDTAPAPARAPLLVLNNSTVTGLAARSARQFAAAGWPIAGVGNLQGDTPETTVYYPPGLAAAARELAAEFPGIRRVLPRPAGLPGSGLTVVLTGAYAGS